ncbi:MAG: nucleoid-associated protein YgaU [Bacteriovoracaceae bacterium]
MLQYPKVLLKYFRTGSIIKMKKGLAMKNSIFKILLLAALLAGCSAKKAKVAEADMDLTELDDTPMEQIVDGNTVDMDMEVVPSDREEDELIVEEITEPDVLDEQERISAEDSEEIIASVQSEEDSLTMADAPPASDNSDMTEVSEQSEYIIQKNDTLMLAAWKIYGDTSRWRELESLNQEKLHNGQIWTGETLVFNRPDSEFVWNPEGSPYLIQGGDTLGVVSNKVYESPKHWKAIWYNNRDLIRNPDLIFAGFTIYYKDLEEVNEREIASIYRALKK